MVAEDGGTPRKSGSMIVDVVITDVNDNSPQFVSDIYNVELTEDAEPQSNVVVVRSAVLFSAWTLSSFSIVIRP